MMLFAAQRKTQTIPDGYKSLYSLPCPPLNAEDYKAKDPVVIATRE